MDNSTGVPPELQLHPDNVGTPPTTPAEPSAHPAPPPKPNAGKKIFRSIAKNDTIQAAFILLVAAFIAGAGYYIGWHRGYNDASNAPSNGQCSASIYNTACNYNNQQHDMLDEPVINLYPTQSEPVNVQVIYPAGLTYTDPTYSSLSGWNVLATPGGTLTNLSDGKQYPYLIWEGNSLPMTINMSTGFDVPGSQTNTFLRTELPIIGLSPAETNAFITYWLPKMSSNKYNLIHFVGKQYADYAKLIISPKPDSELRVMMAFKPLDSPVSVAPQTFPVFHRSGFTVVEWGGTELKP